jgi:hypothetical protein
MSLALADPPPSMTAAHWANRDNETLYRRPGQNGTPRRPPAENSFPEDTGVMQVTRTPQAEPAPALGGLDAGYPHPAAMPASTMSGPAMSGPAMSGPAMPDPAMPGPAMSGPAMSGPAMPDPAMPYPARPGHATFGGADQAAGDEHSRHWTEIGTETRRPRTSDRPEVVAPPAGPAPAPVRSGPRGPMAGGGPGTTGDVAAPTFGYGSGRPTGGRPPAGVPSQRGRRPGSAPDDSVGVLGGPGRDIRPHRANRDGGGKEKPAKDTASSGKRFRPGLWLAVMASVVTVAGAGTAALAVFTGKPAAVASVLGTEETEVSDPRSITAPLQGRTEAGLEIVTGTTQLALRSEDLGEDLYRITAAADSGTLPRAVLNGDKVQLHLTPDGDGATGGVEVVLSSKVRWALRFAGGSDEQKIDMSGGRVASVDIAGGARRFELKLPQASGTVGVRLAGAVDEFVVTAPKDSPVRVQVASGAKTVAAGERTLRDVRPGSTLTPKGWDVDNRYDVDAAAKVSLLSVTPTG